MKIVIIDTGHDKVYINILPEEFEDNPEDYLDEHGFDFKSIAWMVTNKLELEIE